MIETQVTDYIVAFRAKLEVFKRQAQEEFQALFSIVFRQFPELKTIAWRQYTPYFNDGEPCVFRVYNISFSGLVYEPGVTGYNSFDPDYAENEDGPTHFISERRARYDTEGAERTPPALRFLIQELGDLIQVECSDFCNSLFGDHVDVFVTADGIYTEEYEDHD